ncbi:MULTISPECIES: RES family NAD+ phosphorylase [unclassified Enterobacter]|jgi:RES domain-containing protein|uniref:RES family NAD+ phosphorylase n=1 Tax=unclassified Enterobacter TaxID=2608935 RepID=UPI0015CA0D3A|nr:MULTISPECIES: RES family NAD+ phosphorylase [unclassified Enterobacter]MBB3303534.1 RES domain-containing protein [Enterobacter sp. Sphag1F]NYI13361.1 RES domain-containing protein [Enterobacter sp. Sphag71]
MTQRKEPDAPYRLFYRLVKEEYASEAFSGAGAEKWGGRWNPPGIKTVYLSSSKALATLELVVHAGKAMLEKSRFVIFTLPIPESEIMALDSSKLPSDWQKYQQQEETQAIGAAFLDLQGGFPLLLTVPSILTGEDNAILNPDHPAAAALFAQATSAPFALDRRIKA